jgi:hypothetical protein
MNMSLGRIIAIIAALGGGLTAIASLVGQLNPKAGIIVSILALFIAAFTERVQGGLSKFEVVDEEKKDGGE